MKKMIMLAACLLVTAAIQAASIGWTILGANSYVGGGYNLFVIGQNSVTSVGQITALLQSDGLDSISGYAFASGTIANNGAAMTLANNSGKTITYTGPGTETHQAFAVFWDSPKETATWTGIASLPMAKNEGTFTFQFANQSANLSANEIALGGGGDPIIPDPPPGPGGEGGVPEPTSGLLLMVGGALLALRRKQK